MPTERDGWRYRLTSSDLDSLERSSSVNIGVSSSSLTFSKSKCGFVNFQILLLLVAQDARELK